MPGAGSSAPGRHRPVEGGWRLLQSADLKLQHRRANLKIVARSCTLDLGACLVQLRLPQLHNRAETNVVPRLSQIGAWASRQSQPMRGYFELETEVAKAALRFGVGEVRRPQFWSGFRVVPEQIEFWKQMPFRRHERILYTREGKGWAKQWRFP